MRRLTNREGFGQSMAMQQKLAYRSSVERSSRPSCLSRTDGIVQRSEKKDQTQANACNNTLNAENVVGFFWNVILDMRKYARVALGTGHDGDAASWKWTLTDAAIAGGGSRMKGGRRYCRLLVRCSLTVARALSPWRNRGHVPHDSADLSTKGEEEFVQKPIMLPDCMSGWVT